MYKKDGQECWLDLWCQKVEILLLNFRELSVLLLPIVHRHRVRSTDLLDSQRGCWPGFELSTSLPLVSRPNHYTAGKPIPIEGIYWDLEHFLPRGLLRLWCCWKPLKKVSPLFPDQLVWRNPGLRGCYLKRESVKSIRDEANFFTIVSWYPFI